MTRVIVVGIAASTMAIGALTLVGTAATPTRSSDVDDTVRTLEADGYNVIVSRLGAAQLSGCSVAAVRPEAPTISDTVYVDVAC